MILLLKLSSTFKRSSFDLYLFSYSLTTVDLREKATVYSPLTQTGGRAAKAVKVESLS